MSWLKWLFDDQKNTNSSPNNQAPLPTDGTISNVQLLQQVIEQAFVAQTTDWSVNYVGNTRDLTKSVMSKVFEQAIRNVDDYTHYVVKNYTLNAISDQAGNSTITFHVDYRESKAQSAAVTAKAQEVVRLLLTNDMNEHQKVKSLHDWVVLNFAYDPALKYHSAYDGIRFGRSVCEGYSLMIFRLLSTAGIAVRIAEGIGRKQQHAWNIVRIDGTWYHLDATWDDPVPDRPGIVGYDYYLLTDREIERTHAINRNISYPRCSQSYERTIVECIERDRSRKIYYQSLYRTLGFIYWQPEMIVKNRQALEKFIESKSSQVTSSITFRYLQGDQAKQDLSAVLRAINRSAQFSIESFVRAPEGGSVLINLRLE